MIVFTFNSVFINCPYLFQFAAFTANSYNVEKEDNTSIVDDLFNALTPSDSQTILELLLRVLSLLPAEVIKYT